jgi:lipopolysaccharide/colanic/teichoic acid biosynthesis glycosyltransferase
MSERTILRWSPRSVEGAFRFTAARMAVKRLLDIILSVVALVLVLPLMLVIGLAILADSRGRVFYIGRRLGRNGEEFGCWKFRTMHVGADAVRMEVIGRPDDEISDRYREDPRITRVGRVLRRWSLDELPQLFNILGGTMALVGPRPILPEEWELLESDDLRRHEVKPGLTGLWQISGRKDVTWEDRMRMDVRYVETFSLSSDLRILLKTIKVVIVGRGAY